MRTERRSTVRYRKRWVVTAAAVQEGRSWTGRVVTRDLSASGAFLIALARMIPGTALRLRLSLFLRPLGRVVDLVCDAQVVRHDLGGVAVHFETTYLDRKSVSPEGGGVEGGSTSGSEGPPAP